LKFVEKDPNLSYPGRLTLMNLSYEKYGLKKTSSPSLRTYFEKFEKLPEYGLTKDGYEYEVRKIESILQTNDIPTDTDKIKVIAYLRTSTGPQEEQTKIEQQENMILDYIKNHNKISSPIKQLELAGLFREQGSANNPGREVFDHMVKSIKK